MQVVRSPHAQLASCPRNDRTYRYDVRLRPPWVLGVFTAADLASLGTLPCTVPVASIAPMIAPPRHALAPERTRHVGDPVAFVVAETRNAARDAAESVMVDWKELPAIVDSTAAMHADAPQLWDQAPHNMSYRFQKGDADAMQAAMGVAAHVVELELVNNRLVICFSGNRGAIGQYDAAGYHLMFSGAGVHQLQSQLADSVFHVPRDQMHVSCPDVGGGFASRTRYIPNGSCCCGQHGIFPDQSNGSAIAPRTSSPPRKAAPM